MPVLKQETVDRKERRLAEIIAKYKEPKALAQTIDIMSDIIAGEVLEERRVIPTHQWIVKSFRKGVSWQT